MCDEVALSLQSLLVVRTVVTPVWQWQIFEILLAKRHMAVFILGVSVLVAILGGVWEIWHFEI